MLSLPGGWEALSRPKTGTNWQKWVAVRDAAYPVVPGLHTPNGVHRWTRRHVTYTSEPVGADVWQTPINTYNSGKGDCEDFCLLARAELLSLGWAPKDIWLLLVYDVIARMDHAQLFVGDVFLDCRAPNVQQVSTWQDYNPIEAFQDDTYYTFGRKVR